MADGTFSIPAERFAALRNARALEPRSFACAYANRRRGTFPADGRIFIVAADHAARAAVDVGGIALAMGNRYDLLERLATALGREGVDGVLATPDIIDDLAWLGLLEGKIAVASLNRGGLRSSVFEVDDRYTAYNMAAVVRDRLDFAKLLLRIDLNDPASGRALMRARNAVAEAVAAEVPIIVEPFMCGCVDGKLRTDLSTDAVITAVSVASALGTGSAWTWLKLPVVVDMPRVMAATTLPTLLLGGDSPSDPRALYHDWEAALRLPGVRGLVAGRSMLYPSDGDVIKAIDTAAGLVHGTHLA
jgi:hypothetical protein